MELQKFIEQAVLDIAKAIQNGSNEMKFNGTGNGIPDDNDIKVNFDIAVTVSNNDTTEGGGKISVLGPYLNFLGSKKSEKDVEYVSRLTFSVPIKIKTFGQNKYNIG